MNWSLNWRNKNDFQYSDNSGQRKYELVGVKTENKWKCELRSFGEGSPSLMTVETQVSSFTSESPEEAVNEATEIIQDLGR